VTDRRCQPRLTAPACRSGGEFGGGLCRLAAQPGDEVAGLGLCRQVERGEVVRADPVEVGAAVEEVFGSLSSAVVAGRPEGDGDLVGCRDRPGGERGFDPVEQAEGGGVLESGRGAPFDEAASGLPLTEAARVGQRGAAAEDGAEASMSAPASRSASRASTSSLLAAQCSGVSAWEPWKRAFTSAPARTRRPMTWATLG
jgi:hypothetical protein